MVLLFFTLVADLSAMNNSDILDNGKTYGVGTVSFNQHALEEFIILLKRHSYESFVRASQS